MMGRYNRGANTNIYFMLSDIVFSCIAFAVSCVVSGMFPEALDQRYGLPFLGFLVIYMLLAKDLRLYNTTTFFYKDRYIRRITRAFLFALAVSFILLYAGGNEIPDARFYRIFLLLEYVLLVASSFIVYYVVNKVVPGKSRTLFVGDERDYAQVLRFIDKSGFCVDLAGYVSVDGRCSGGKYVGRLQDLEQIIREYVIDEVFLMTSKDGEAYDVQQCIDLCMEMGITVRIVCNSYSAEIAQSYVSSIGTYPVITYHTVSLNRLSRAFKRSMDIIGALIGLTLSLPVMVVTAIAIKLESKGPVIFKQKRVGLNGRCFNMYKFRSMCQDAEVQKQALMRKNEINGGYMFKIHDDPRITRVGKFIRNTSIDEIPQFFNILLGDMSLVGTRPPLVEEVRQYRRNHWRRISVKPGLTGMWQISGRSSIKDFEEVVKLDVAYIDQWNMAIDIKIILLTVWKVIRKSGAF